jgi:hypothetical protein
METPSSNPYRFELADPELKVYLNTDYYQNLHYKEHAKHLRHLKLKSLKEAFRYPCKDSLENIFERYFYLFKLLICSTLLFWRRRPEPYYKHGTIEVVTLHYAKLYAGWEATFWSVGYGYWKGWFASIETDGDWYM